MSTTQALWLMVAAQLLLFGGLWWLAAQRVRRRAPALRDIGRFNAWLGLALAGVAARGTLPPLLTHAGAEIGMLWAMLCLWRGLHGLMRLPPLEQPQTLVAVAAGAIALMAQADAAGPARAAVLLLTLAWLTGRLTAATLRPLAASLGEAASRSLGLLCGGLVALMLLRAVTGLWLDWPMEVHVDSPGTLLFCYLSMAVLFALNAVLAASVQQRIVARLVRASRQDPATGLANRLALDEVLAQAWARWGRERRGFAVLTLALEGYEEAIVTGHGRAAAEDVLRRVAAVVSHELRQTDLLAHGSGHQLVALLDGEHRSAGIGCVAARLQATVAAMRLLPHLPTLRLRLGVGGALVLPGDGSAAGVLARAQADLARSGAGGGCGSIGPVMSSLPVHR